MINRSAKVLFLFILLVNISACDRHKCSTCPTVTLPGGYVTEEQCYDGQCVCPDGYEGDACGTYSYLKYVGNYYGSENCGGVYNNYPNYYCNIFSAAGTNGYGVNYIGISSFLGIGTVYALIENTGSGINEGCTIYILPIQLGSIYISGSYGTYFPNTGGVADIVINLNYQNQSGNFQCQETLYLQ